MPHGPVEGYKGPARRTGNPNPEADPTTGSTNDHGEAPSDRQGNKRSPGTPGCEVQLTKTRQHASPIKKTRRCNCTMGSACLTQPPAPAWQKAWALRGLRAHREMRKDIKTKASCDNSKEAEKKCSSDIATPRILDCGGNDGGDGDKSKKPAEKDVGRSRSHRPLLQGRKRRTQRHQCKCQ